MAKHKIYGNRRERNGGGDKISRYNQRTLHEDREYGFYWYAWLWGLLRTPLVFLCALTIVIGLVASGINYVNMQFFMPVNPDITETSEFVIERGSSITKISNKLEEEGFVRNKTIFKSIVSLQGLGGKIQYGSYPLSPSMDVNEVITALTAGGNNNERVITIIPGWTINDIAEYLQKAGAIKDTTEFFALCNDIEKFRTDYYVVEQAYESQNTAGRIHQLEGYLAPDTYRVYSNASAEEILRVLLKQMDSVVDKVFYPTGDIIYDENGSLVDQEPEERYNSQLTQEQIVILASMIEREAGKKADYSKVSAVFHNRLAKDIPLDSDATISYALGLKRIVLTNDDLNADTKYNTYLNKGLPVGPICNPSRAALQAALYPDLQYIEEGYMYFCSKDPTTNELEFSKTNEEHRAAVEKYRPLWEAYDKSQGN